MICLQNNTVLIRNDLMKEYSSGYVFKIGQFKFPSHLMFRVLFQITLWGRSRPILCVWDEQVLFRFLRPPFDSGVDHGFVGFPFDSAAAGATNHIDEAKTENKKGRSIGEISLSKEVRKLRIGLAWIQIIIPIKWQVRQKVYGFFTRENELM